MRADRTFTSLAAEPADLFPRAVRRQVLSWLWVVLAILLVVLAVLVVEYGRMTGT